MEAVLIINIVKTSILSADIVTDPIIGTSLIISKETWWKTYTFASIAIKNQENKVENMHLPAFTNLGS